MKISRSIHIEPEQLRNVNLYSFFASQARATIGEYIKNHGYVIDIKTIDCTYSPIKISRMNSNLFTVITYDALFLKPEIDDEYTAKVSLIIPQGIIVIILDLVKMIIPTIETSVEVGDWLQVKVTNVKEFKNNLSCIGELVESSP